MANISKIKFKGVEYNIKPLTDVEPTEGSTNAVQSGGVFDAVKKLDDFVKAGLSIVKVNLKSLMFDHDKVYLYTGSEPNESTGYWYHWNGTQFVPGGLYGAGITDAVPTQGSTNAVQSGGVYDEITSLNGDLNIVSDDVNGLGSGLIESVATEITDLTEHDGYRYGTGGNLVELTPASGSARAVSIAVEGGERIKWVGYYANRNSTYNVKYKMSDNSIVSDTNYTESGEYIFVVPQGCIELLISCWILASQDAYFYLITKEITSAKNYTDTAVATAKATIGQETADEFNMILDASFGVEAKTGTTLVIDDSAVDSVKGIQTQASKVYVSGINLWDETWEIGGYSTSTGLPDTATNKIRSKSTNPIPIHPETDYYVKAPYNLAVMWYKADGTYISYVAGTNKKVTSPANAYYMRFYVAGNYGLTYNNDIQVTFDSESAKATYHSHHNKQFDDLTKVKLYAMAKNYVYAIESADTISVTYYKKESYGYIAKKPYQSGFIVFTVPSRITKPNNSVSASSTSEGTDDSVNVNCILKLPTTYTPNGDPTKLIMICHGAGQSAQSWATNASYIALVTAFTDAGYAVFDCNGYQENVLGYSFWGDSRGVDVWRKAYQYVVDNYNVEHQFGLYGFSMGGLTALNLAFSGFPNIKCIALGSPVVSLEACYDSESVKAVIKVLYGMGDTYNPALAYGCDPFARMIEIGVKKYIFGKIPPLKMWYGSTETGTTDTGAGEVVTGVVVKAYGEAIVTAINNAGGQAEYREVANAGHEICYGGNAVVNSDLVLFFNRHCL